MKEILHFYISDNIVTARLLRFEFGDGNSQAFSFYNGEWHRFDKWTFDSLFTHIWRRHQVSEEVFNRYILLEKLRK